MQLLIALSRMSNDRIRTIFFYKDYFTIFFEKQKQKVRDKILWTLRIIETLPQVPATYLKHLEGTDGLYEIRVQQGSDNFSNLLLF